MTFDFELERRHSDGFDLATFIALAMREPSPQDAEARRQRLADLRARHPEGAAAAEAADEVRRRHRDVVRGAIEAAWDAALSGRPGVARQILNKFGVAGEPIEGEALSQALTRAAWATLAATLGASDIAVNFLRFAGHPRPDRALVRKAWGVRHPNLLLPQRFAAPA
jgi:hypothetical protein